MIKAGTGGRVCDRGVFDPTQDTDHVAILVGDGPQHTNGRFPTPPRQEPQSTYR